MSTKQLYLVIRLPESSSTTVPLPKVVDLKPKSSTGVLTTIIGLAKDKYLYSYTFHPNHIIYRYNKQGGNSNQTHRKINEYFYSFTTNPKPAILKE